MDLQTALTIIVSLVAFIVLILAIYLFVVLKDLHQAVKKLNTALDHLDLVSELFSDPASAIMSLVQGIVSTFHSVRSRR